MEMPSHAQVYDACRDVKSVCRFVHENPNFTRA